MIFGYTLYNTVSHRVWVSFIRIKMYYTYTSYTCTHIVILNLGRMACKMCKVAATRLWATRLHIPDKRHKFARDGK